MSRIEIVSILSPHHCDSKLVVLILCFCLTLLLEHLLWHVCVSDLEGPFSGELLFPCWCLTVSGGEMGFMLCAEDADCPPLVIVTVGSWNHQFKF